MTTIGITVGCRPDGQTRALGGISTARCSLSSVRSWMTGMLYHSSHHFSPISRNTHQFKTVQVEFECAFLGEESTIAKASRKATWEKVRAKGSKGRNHPFEGTLSQKYERIIAQVSRIYISVWPNENQSDSYHETRLWPWPFSSISIYHQLCEIVVKRRSISRKGIHSWWQSA
jgi:hypothetical protein